MNSRILEIASVLMRLDRIASFIVNANHSIVSGVVHADEKLTAFLELERVTRESLRVPNAE